MSRQTRSLTGLTKQQRQRLTGHIHYVLFGLKILRQDIRAFQASVLVDEAERERMEKLVERLTDEILFLKTMSPDQYRNIKQPLMQIIATPSLPKAQEGQGG